MQNSTCPVAGGGSGLKAKGHTPHSELHTPAAAGLTPIILYPSQ